MPDKFRVTYYAADGYIGKDRPRHFAISADDFDDDSEDQLRALFGELLEEEFRQNVVPSTEDEDRFVDWAKSIQASRKDGE